MTDWQNSLEEDLSWREAELASLKRLAIVNSDNAVISRTLLRACWALLYAHFEGFTLFTWETLIDYIQAENVLMSDLNDDFKKLALEKNFRELRGDTSSDNLWNFYKVVLPQKNGARALFNADCRLKTKSNLYPNVFEDECLKIGVQSCELDKYRSRIRALVSRRNDIAHGKKMVINSIQEYSEYENATFLVLHDLVIQVIDIIEKKKFNV